MEHDKKNSILEWRDDGKVYGLLEDGLYREAQNRIDDRKQQLHALQGVPPYTLAYFIDILCHVAYYCIFLIVLYG